jgi:hypothetical protein
MKNSKDEIKRFKEFRDLMLLKKSQMYAAGNLKSVYCLNELIEQFIELYQPLKTIIENEKIDN